MDNTTKSKMNQKAYSILFCALFASTFVHEIRAKASANPSFAHQVLERAADPQTCEIICGDSNSNTTVNVTTGLTIVANADANLFGIVNTTANVGLIIDINANLVVVFNGTSGAAVAINLKTNVGVYISKGVWVAANISFTAYIASLSSGLSGLFKISIAVSFQVATASTAILQVINGIVAYLIVNIASELQVNAKVGIQILVAIAIQKITLLRGSLNGVLSYIGTTAIVTSFDLAQIINFDLAVASILVNISGGFAGLIKAGVIINLNTLLKSGSGLEILAKLFLAIGAKLDIGSVFGGVVNNVEGFFNFTTQLGGGGNDGLNGVFKVVASIIAYINGHVRLEVVINVLIQYLAYNGGSKQDLSLALNGTLSVLLETIEHVGATQSLSGLVITIKALLNGTLVVKGVSISAIIRILVSGVLRGVSYLLQVLVAVLLELRVIVKVAESLPICLLVLIININTAIGIQILRGLGIAIDISLTAAAGGIVAFLLKSVSNIARLLVGDLYGALVTIPGIGKIVIALNAAISAASNGSLNLKNLLRGSSLVSGLIKGFIQLLGGIYLGVSSSTIAHIRGLITLLTSTTSYININVSVSAGSNSSWSSNSTSSWSSNSSSSSSWGFTFG